MTTLNEIAAVASRFRISPEDTWSLWAVIIAGTCAAIWLERTYRWAAKLSGPVLALIIAMILANLRIMPAEAPSYAFVGDYLVPLAIPLLLFRANLVKIARETGWMFLGFHLSTLGTIAGAALAVVLLGDRVPETSHVAGIMTGSYIGGAVNFFAVKESFNISENLTNPLLVADNVIMAGMFIALLFIVASSFFQRLFPHSRMDEENLAESGNLAAEHWRRKEISLLDIASALAVAMVVVAVAKYPSALMASVLPAGILADVLGNLFVHITFLSMVIATVFHRQIEAIHGAEEMGTYMLYVFLFQIGLPADLRAVLANAPILFLFCLIMAVTNLVVTLALGRLFRLDLRELALCVNATLGGAPSAAAMAVAKGWTRLVLPALLVGIWGYVIGTFLGVLVGRSIAEWLRS
ncbi:MAG TPA: hypothetical protein DD670_15135 [Planctomycetaceae bacterium]|nr:hypothetical protein [Planctomycetaceae bacterium]